MINEIRSQAVVNEKEIEVKAVQHDKSPLGDHWLHGKRNEEPGGGEAENRAGQAGDQDVKGAGFCHGSSSDLFVQANLEHGGNLRFGTRKSRVGFPTSQTAPVRDPKESFKIAGYAGRLETAVFLASL